MAIPMESIPMLHSGLDFLQYLTGRIRVYLNQIKFLQTSPLFVFYPYWL